MQLTLCTFRNIERIITETGGQLSHLAIVAREQGFPLLLQTARATTAIREGEWLRVAGDGNVIRE